MSFERPRLNLFLAATLALLTVTAAAAQEFRATVTGRVADPAGLAIPGVTVSAVNIDTTEVATTVTSAEGAYTLPFLKPGVYRVSAEVSGFSRYEQPRVELEVGQARTINIQLQVGVLSETITVSAEAVEASKADRGMVVDRSRLIELPLSGRNPFMLSALAPGVTYNGPAINQRPFDNGGGSDWSINGGQNRNTEFLLDGAPNNAVQAGGNMVAYVPSVDAVQEFKIVTNGYDAQYGRSAGGIVNVSLKSGTNRFHGTAYEFMRRSWLDSKEDLFIRNDRAKPDHRLDQFGFQIDGPIFRNKTFFMATYEGYREATPNAGTLTYPDAAQIRGDFSNLRDAQGNLITIYDPATGRLQNGQWVRDPFPGNIIPEHRINPIARQLLSSYGAPNTTPTSGDPWRNNFLAAPNLAYDTFHNIAAKVDQNVSDRTRLFVRYGQNTRTEKRNTNGITTGPAQDGQLPLQRINYTGVGDLVRTTGASLVLNLRTSLSRYTELSRSDVGLAYDPADLGFSPETLAELPNRVYPRIIPADYASLGRQGFSGETSTIYSLQPNIAWTRGSHTVRGGLDMRLTWFTRENNGNLFFLQFDRRYTQRVFNQGDARSGNSIASLLLGAPSAGAVDNNFFPSFRWNYFAPWVQDDWKVSDRLTVNLGLRWDLNTPVHERDDRLNHGFDVGAINPVSARIDQARFPGYQVRGGVGFVGVDGNPGSAHRFDGNNVQPRVGAAYLLDEKTILRAGYGLYYLNPTTTGFQNGYSVQTSLVATLDDHRTPTYALTNPFPTVTDAPGSAQGLETFLGRNPNFSNPGFETPRVHQFSMGVQRQLPWRTTVELSYVGSRTRGAQSQWNGFNDPPIELRNQCDPTLGGSPSYCNQLLPNPFYQVPGFEGTPRFTSPTLSRYELSRPYPQFGGIAQLDRNDGRLWYNSLQLYANKRVSDGVSLAGTWTWSKTLEEGGAAATDGGSTFVDSQRMNLQRSPYQMDRRHRVTLSGVYELPFGKGRRFMREANPIVNGIAGGWQVAGLWLFNTGRPWQLPGNVFYVKDATIHAVDYDAEIVRGVQPCVARMSDAGVVTMESYSRALGCTEPNFIIRPNYTGRTTQFRDDRIRRPGFSQFDLAFSKTAQINGTLRLQVRFELFNVLNQAIYDEREWNNNPSDANFGTINRTIVRQSNLPRYGQLGFKLLF